MGPFRPAPLFLTAPIGSSPTMIIRAPRSRRRFGFVVALFAVVASLSGPAHAIGRVAETRATFGIQPANAAGKPDTRATLNYGVTPLARLDDRVVVVNYSAVPLTLAVYATDAFNDAKGGFSLLDGKQKPKDAGSWIRVATPGGRGFLVLPARSSVVVPVRLAVPKGALPGDHIAGVVASLTSAGQGGKVNVRLDQRVATRVFVRVSGPLRPGLTITQVHTRYHDNFAPFFAGTAEVTYRVRNTGNVKLAGRPSVIITGLLGARASARALAQIPLLFPGSSVDLRARITGVLPEFRETTTVTVRPLVLAGDSDPGLVIHGAVGHFWAIPWVVVAVILLLVAITYVRLRRRRRPDSSAKHAASVAGRPGVKNASVLLVATGLILTGSGSAWAESPAPYQDPAAEGMALCDDRGRLVTSGKLTESQIAVKAVSAYVPPGAYAAVNGTSQLLAYQPRQGVLPGDWSGEQLTAVSTWTDRKHPSVQILASDTSLAQSARDIPPRWDGILQLRMYFDGPGGVYSTRYPAADIRISGGRWTQLNPVNVPCTSGSATSDIVKLGLDTPSSPAVAGATPSASRTVTATTTKPTASATHGAAGTLGGTSAANPALTPSNDKQATGDGTHELGNGHVVAAVLAGCVLIGAISYALRRRRVNST